MYVGCMYIYHLKLQTYIDIPSFKVLGNRDFYDIVIEKHLNLIYLSNLANPIGPIRRLCCTNAISHFSSFKLKIKILNKNAGSSKENQLRNTYFIKV